MDKIHTIYEFNPEIYPRRLWVSCGCPIDVLRDMFGKELPEMNEASDADTVNCRRLKPDLIGGVLIRFRNKNTMTTCNIAHESTHAALSIFDYVEARIHYENQEPFSYLVGWIAGCCQQVKSGKCKQDGKQ